MAQIDYLKYIIEFHFDNTSYITLWGADKSDKENDKFLIDSKQNILLFKRIQELRNYIQDPMNIVFDNQSSKEWASKLKDNYDPFYIVDFEEISKFQHIHKKDFSHSSINELIDFLNLFGDYAFQIKNDLLISLFKDETIQFIIDFNYDTEFWESDDPRIIELNEEMRKFDLSKFGINLSRIRNEMIKRLILLG